MMDFNFKCPAWLEAGLTTQGTTEFLGIRHGIEREGLRITPQAHLAQTPHPRQLGSALTHPFITTDYAESLLELVTPVTTNIADLDAKLTDLHHFVSSQLADEALWPLSMPCFIEDESDIAIANYGSSNIGQMKRIYRLGLKHRYGSLMQTIAGVHFNFSFSDNFWRTWAQDTQQQGANTGFMQLVRNFYRVSWLLPYLFGASPVVSKTFLDDKSRKLLPFEFQNNMAFLPYATSLRLSGLGYTSHAQDDINLDLNSLSGYVSSLQAAVSTSYPPFAKLGVKVNGHYRQLNDRHLQLENELYTPIRPKCVAFSGEKPSSALAKRGIEYIELRACDVNPFTPTGMSHEQIYFYDLLLLGCLLHAPDTLDQHELACHRHNLEAVAVRGRAANTQLKTCTGSISLQHQGEAILESLKPLAILLDANNMDSCYQNALDAQLAKIASPEKTLSAQVLQASLAHPQGFIGWGKDLAYRYKTEFMQGTYRAWNRSTLVTLAEQSLQEQDMLETKDTQDFDTFLTNYMQSA